MILITGASGTVGGALASAMNHSGQAFRAAYHFPEKAERAQRDGYETVTIDMARPETLPGALEGIDTVFLLGAGVRGQAEREANMVRAATTAGVKRLVKLSVWRAGREEHELARMHRSVERAIEASGMAWTFLRANGFMQNFSGALAETIKMRAAIYQPAAHAKISFVDVRDIAAAAVIALTNTSHEGKAYELSGPDALSHSDIAAILSRVLGKDVTYVPVADDAARTRMIEAGMPDFYADALIDLFRVYREGVAARVSSDLEKLTGRAPIAFERFAREHADRWR